MYPHRIRLRGPWEMTRAGETPRRVMFPTSWADIGLTDFAGPVDFERRFGYPGRIDAHERVWLIGEGLVGPANIALQGESLGIATNRFAFEVTGRLRDRNVLKISLDVAPERLGLWDNIALEVRATAYFDGISRDGKTVRGRVAGTCDGLLEVYALADGRTCGYREVMAGVPFEIALERDASSLRVELVNVSTVWDVVELA
jgi:hypothetical protein